MTEIVYLVFGYRTWTTRSIASNTCCRVFKANKEINKAYQTFLEKNLNLTFLMIIKDFHIYSFQNCINILLDQKLSLLQENVQSNVCLRT